MENHHLRKIFNDLVADGFDSILLPFDVGGHLVLGHVTHLRIILYFI